MPFNLYLDETDDDPLNNLSNFYFWCANRILPANRQHKDVILKSLNLITKEPAQIALLCHCLSLTDGCFPKAWLNNTLLKGGNPIAVRNEILDSEICQYFQCNQVLYKEGIYKGELVSISNLFTSKEQSIVSKEAFDIYAVNYDIDPIKYILSLDAYSYYMMNILDYLTGNTDRHWGNWGFLIDNQTNTPISLPPLMDFN